MSKKTAEKLTARREENWEFEDYHDRWGATPKELVAAYRGGMRDFSGVRVTDTPDYPLAYNSVSFEGACFSHARFSRCNLSEVSFKGCDVSNAFFDQTELYQADFEGADCQYTSFDKASLRSANFKGANCYRADFEGADVGFANFEGADLRRSVWHFSNLTAVKLEEAHLNWASHWLLSHILTTGFLTATQKWAVSFIRGHTHLCWDDFTEPLNLPEQLRPEISWAVLRLSHWVYPNTEPEMYPPAVLNAAQKRWDFERAQSAPKDEDVQPQPPSN